MKKKFSSVCIIIGCLLIVVGLLQKCFHKEYLMREYGFGCRNVDNQVSSSFELKETTKVYFQFYCKAEGFMEVNVRDSAEHIIFQTNNVNFEEHFTKELSAGVYYFDISYHGINGDFELYAVVRSFLGVVF